MPALFRWTGVRIFHKASVSGTGTRAADGKGTLRFTRVAPDTINYEIVINDQTTWTKPWTAAIRLKQTQEKLYEFACHEGSHEVIDGILRGPRMEDKAAEEAGKGPLPSPEPGTWFDYQVVNVYPHDRQAFTQGLVFRDGFLFESTGRTGQSSLRKVQLETGRVIQQISIESPYFAEGLADYGNRLIQLTWQSHVGFVYDLETFAPARTFGYPGEGWGLAREKNRLVMSDGTSVLRFLDPETLQETGPLAVTEGTSPVSNLNELEVVKGEIFANVWRTDYIVIIQPETGHVSGWIDLRGLLSAADRTQPVDMLNGIAYDSEHDRLFVTGKLWPRLFEIRIERRR